MKTRTCPVCEHEFKRKKKGGCPACKTKLFYDANGDARRESDKVTVDKLLKILSDSIFFYTKVNVNLKNDPVERKFGYVFLDETRKFLAKQETKMNAELFVADLLNEIYSDRWWSSKINAANLPIMPKLKNQVTRFGSDLYRKKRDEQVKELAQLRRLDNQIMLGVDYGL
jgi:hypothetical protein